MPTAPTFSLKPPFEIALSSDLKVRYGFVDAHVELEAKVPFLPLGKFRKSFTKDEFKLGLGAFSNAKQWRDVPDFQRRRDAPPQPFVQVIAQDIVKVSMLYGFADAHADLVIEPSAEQGSGLKAKLLGALAKKLPDTLKYSFSAEEIDTVEPSFRKVDAWATLPEAERKKLCG